MAVESKSKPNPSYVSSSQPARFRVIRGELSPAELASSTSNDDLNKSIEGGIAQASVMWLLCRRSVVI